MFVNIKYDMIAAGMPMPAIMRHVTPVDARVASEEDIEMYLKNVLHATRRNTTATIAMGSPRKMHPHWNTLSMSSSELR